jgi:hypothetical protein
MCPAKWSHGCTLVVLFQLVEVWRWASLLWAVRSQFNLPERSPFTAGHVPGYDSGLAPRSPTAGGWNFGSRARPFSFRDGGPTSTSRPKEPENARRAISACWPCAICPSCHSAAGCALAYSGNRNKCSLIPLRHEGRTRRHERGAECGGREGAGDVRHRRGRRSRVVLSARQKFGLWKMKEVPVK